MKKIILIAVALFGLTLNSFSQKEYKYCELVGMSKFLSNKIIVAVDSGQGGGLNWSNMIKDTIDVSTPIETKNEKFYVTTKEKTYEGKIVQSDSKGTFIWKKVEIGGQIEQKVKNKSFNSMVDGMNYMGKDGWEFVQAYVVTLGNQNVYHWLLKKTK